MAKKEKNEELEQSPRTITVKVHEFGGGDLGTDNSEEADSADDETEAETVNIADEPEENDSGIEEALVEDIAAPEEDANGEDQVEEDSEEDETQLERAEDQEKGEKILRAAETPEPKRMNPIAKIVSLLVLAAIALVAGFWMSHLVDQRTVPVTEEFIEGQEPVGVVLGKKGKELGKIKIEKSQGLVLGEGATEQVRKKHVAEKLQQVASTGKKFVALTFDDGPSYATTPRLLDILKAKQAKATFFVVGTMAERAPDLLQREVAEGHEVGSHTVAHVNLNNLGAAETQAEAAAMDQMFERILGRPVGIMRPPYGNYTNVTKANIGQPMIIWTVDTLDWKYRNPASVRQGAVSAAFDGAIILMHDIHSTTIDAVAGIIDDLRAQGYEFVTVSELAAMRGVSLVDGAVYGGFRP